VLNLPGDVPNTFPANYPEFPDSWIWIKFTFFVDILQMLIDRPHILLE
jgi:hypothetical protein